MSHCGVARVDVVGAIDPGVDPLVGGSAGLYPAAADVLFHQIIGRIPQLDGIRRVAERLAQQLVKVVNLFAVDFVGTDVDPGVAAHKVYLQFFNQINLKRKRKKEKETDGGRLDEPDDPRRLAQTLKERNELLEAMLKGQVAVSGPHVMEGDAKEDVVRGSAVLGRCPIADDGKELVVQARLPMEGDFDAVEQRVDDAATHVAPLVVGRRLVWPVSVGNKLDEIVIILPDARIAHQGNVRPSLWWSVVAH